MNSKKLLLIIPVLFLTGCTDTVSCAIGDATRVGDIQYKVNSVSNTKSISYVYTTDYNYVIINITISNQGKEQKTIYADMMTIYVNKSAYNMNMASIYLENGFSFSQTIGAGMEYDYNITFETLTEPTENDYLLVRANSNSSKAARIFLKEKAHN